MTFKNLLIVDDSSTSRMIIQRCFDISGLAPGAEYKFAADGLEAMGALESGQNFDLIVTDLNMPKLDGENFIKKIRMKPGFENANVLVISSMGDSAVEDSLKAMGVISIIKKPISPQKILEALGR